MSLDLGCSFMDLPIHRQHQPTRRGSCLPCPQHRQYLCRSGSDSPRRSPWAGPSAPSSRPLQRACARPVSSSPGSAREGAVDQGVRWRDSAELWCVGNQSRGSSGCRAGREAHRLRASELVHHPTGHCQLFDLFKAHESHLGQNTYPFHPESTASVHHFKELLIFLAAEEAQARNLKVGPEVAHVVALTLHSLGIDIWKTITARVGEQNLFGQRRCFRVGRSILLFWLGLGLDEHLPQSFGLETLEAFVGSRVAPDIGDGLAELLDSDREAVGFVIFDHGLERITVK